MSLVFPQAITFGVVIHHCYAQYDFVLGDELLSFVDAEAYCNNQGYHLASIHSDEENEAAKSACATTNTSDCWIGLNCIDGDWGDWYGTGALPS